MKQIALTLMCALIALGSVSAEGDTYSEPEFGPVEFYDFDLEVEHGKKQNQVSSIIECVL